jgi:glycosyltransferase involved in cell wall biosynthesis
MNILYIIPGSGNSFYCGNCLRDSKYVGAVRALGHRVVKIPMYLPLFSDNHDPEGIPLFYGAISIYLKQLYPFLRKAPAWFDRLLNAGPLLKLAARMSGSTRARGLGELTVSMLMGEHGEQKDELDRMVTWIAEHCQPDLIHLSNALLLGLSGRIKERLDVPVVCSLQDEDVWVDVMKPAFRDRAWELMREDAAHVDLFVAVSDYYGKIMTERMNLPAAKVQSLHLGVSPEDYPAVPAESKGRNIGFISRMNHENGLDILVDAFIQLKRRSGFEDVRLVLTGGSTGDDTKYIRSNRKKLARAGLLGHVDVHDDFIDGGRMEFFRKVSVVSVPVRMGEAFGLYLVEAMASGVPVVQPALGAFPEIVGATGGGIIYQGNTPENLAGSLEEILGDRDLLRQKSLDARSGTLVHFDITRQSRKMIEAYQTIIKS